MVVATKPQAWIEQLKATSDVPPAELLDTEIKLLYTIQHPEDKELAERYLGLRSGIRRFDRLFHNARGAYYLADPVKYPFKTVPGITRALDNVELGERLVSPKEFDLGNGYHIAHRKRFHGGPWIPEAAWNFALFHGKDVVGRFGINFHKEGTQEVASLMTIQAMDSAEVDQFNESMDEPWALASLREIASYFKDEGLVVRGVPAKRHPHRNMVRDGRTFHLDSTSGLYDGTFKKLGMKRVGTVADPKWFEFEK